jgi:hypothetical protein
LTPKSRSSADSGTDCLIEADVVAIKVGIQIVVIQQKLGLVKIVFDSVLGRLLVAVAGLRTA